MGQTSHTWPRWSSHPGGAFLRPANGLRGSHCGAAAFEALSCACKMAVAADCSVLLQPGGRAGRAWDTGAAGSLVLRRMDRRGHKRGLVRAKKHGTKSGTGAPAPAGFSFC